MTAMKTTVQQKAAGSSTDPNLVLLGQRIRTARERAGMTLEGLAGAAKLSKGLLSKIENFRTPPSLPVLFRIAQGLGVDPADLVRELGQPPALLYTVVRRDEGHQVQREEGIGFRYRHLLGRFIGDLSFEAFRLSLLPGSKRRAVTTDGDEFLYVLEGSITLALGHEKILLSAGDAIFFDGRVPHVPKNRGNSSSEILVIYLMQRNGEETGRAFERKPTK